MFKKPVLWISGAGIGVGLLVLLIGLLWGLVLRLLQMNRQQLQAASQAALSSAGGHSGKMTVQPTADIAGTDALTPEMLAAVMVAVEMHRRIRRQQAAPAMRTHQPGTLPSRWIGSGRASQNLSWHPRRR